MTAPVLDLTERNILTALRSFLLAALPAGIEVVRGQGNRTPEPAGPNFVIMTPILRERIETNTTTYHDGAFDEPPTPGTVSELQPIKATIQIDIHGPASADNSQIVTTLFRSQFAVDQFDASGFSVAPLYTSDPRQVPFANGEQQIEERWTLDAVIQANPVVTSAQDFASALEISLVEVDATYPP